MCEDDLSGLRVLVTRERDASRAFARLLEVAGARPVVCPAIEIVFLNRAEFDAALQTLASFDWLVLTSANAVRALADRFRTLELDLKQVLSSVPIAVVGRATGAAVTGLGGKPAVVADPAHAANLAGRLEAQGLAGARVLFPASRIARPELSGRLAAAGAEVVQLAVYDTVAPAGLQAPPPDAVDVATFTSPSTIKNFVHVAGTSWFAEVPVICIGPTTAAAAREAGISDVHIAGEASLAGIVETLNVFVGQREQVVRHGTG